MNSAPINVKNVFYITQPLNCNWCIFFMSWINVFTYSLCHLVTGNSAMFVFITVIEQ